MLQNPGHEGEKITQGKYRNCLCRHGNPSLQVHTTVTLPHCEPVPFLDHYLCPFLN